jgi:hypothetical protein
MEEHSYSPVYRATTYSQPWPQEKVSKTPTDNRHKWGKDCSQSPKVANNLGIAVSMQHTACDNSRSRITLVSQIFEHTTSSPRYLVCLPSEFRASHEPVTDLATFSTNKFLSAPGISTVFR